MEFKHIPIMLNQCIDGLDIKPNGIYVDGTLGGAGHSKEILKRLSDGGLLIGIDKDQEALDVATKRLCEVGKNFVTVKDDFKDFDNILNNLKIDKVDGVLLDLGVSSYQLDNAQRGFSYIKDAPLDMRMDKSNPLTAEIVVNQYSPEKLTEIFYEYGEEPFTKNIVKNIVEFRRTQKIETTGMLAQIIKNSVPKKVQIVKGNPCKRVFQAIRIEVNGELEGLKEVLEKMIARLKKGGRIAVITFHSLEDRIVKNVFKLCETDCICPKNIPVCVCHHKASIKLINKKPIVADSEELKNNSRSASAKLRIAEKIV